MTAFNATDWVVLVVYFLSMLGIGIHFYKRSQSPEGFTAGGRSVPGWVCGLSIFATYLSSISYLALAGKSFTSNWNPFVFSLSIPIAAWIASRFFIPYYRKSKSISAYALLEERFGTWARVFGSSFYLLYQIARTAIVLYLMALPMEVIFGWNIVTVLLITGIIVTAYSLIGGILAVLWSDAIQAIVLMVGAVLCLLFLLGDLPEGVQSVTKAAEAGEKFSLGSPSIRAFSPDFVKASIWVILLYGLIENLKNFGIDQSYIQRYVASDSEEQARRGLWLGALLYIPVSALFFFIGTSLFAYYGGSDQVPPQANLDEVREVVATRDLLQQGVKRTDADFDAKVHEASLSVPEGRLGDSVFPHFISQRLPHGLKGLLVAAIFAAAMSTASTGLNSSATLLASDFYKRFHHPQASRTEEMRVLRIGTILWGTMGTALSLLFVSLTDSILDTWWVIAGVLGAGKVGLFLLGISNKRATKPIAITATIVGLVTIGVFTFFKVSPSKEDLIHPNLISVVGVLAFLLVGGLAFLPSGKRQTLNQG